MTMDREAPRGLGRALGLAGTTALLALVQLAPPAAAGQQALSISPWRAPELRATSDQLSGLKVNSLGDAVVAWRDGSGTQMAMAVRRAGDSWSAPIAVPVPEGAAASAPVIDEAGNVLFAWATAGGAIQAVSWSAARERFGPPVLVAEGQGVPASIWPSPPTKRQSWPGRSVRLEGPIRVAVRPSGQAEFAPSQTLSERPGLLTGVAVDETGSAVLSWLERPPPPEVRQNLWLAMASVRPAGGSWGPREELPGGPVGFLGVQTLDAGDGNAAVGSSRTSEGFVVPIASLRTPSSGWSPFEEIPGREVASRLRLVGLDLDARGNALALIETGGSEPHGVATSERPAGGGWSGVQRLAGPGRQGASLAVSDTGSAVLSWTETDAGSRVFRARLRPAPATPWTPVEEIARGPQDAFRGGSAVTDEAGRAIAAWAQDGRIFTADRIAGAPAAIRLTTAQLRTNQRIAQAAVRRANSLMARLGGGVSGSDIRAGALDAAHFSGGVNVVGAETGALVAPGPADKLRVPDGDPGAGSIRLDAKQTPDQSAHRSGGDTAGERDPGDAQGRSHGRKHRRRHAHCRPPRARVVDRCDEP